MGKIKVYGKAIKDYDVDVFNLKIKIIAKSKVFGEAAEMGKSRTEQFLLIMKDKLGLQPDDFLAGDYSIGQGSYSSTNYLFQKSFSIMLNADLPLLERITDLLKDMSDMEYKIEYILSDEAKKSSEVLQMAIDDSRKKADVIAGQLGQKVVGAEEVSFDYDDYNADENVRCLCKSITVEDCEDMASQLKNPIKTIRKSVGIVWITE